MSVIVSPSEAMDLAIAEARKAGASGEVPVGATLVSGDGRLRVTIGNSVEQATNPCAHAEMRALQQGAALSGAKYLTDHTLYVTLEPCPMCAAAMVHFKLGRLVFGAYDPKGGGVEHGPRIFQQTNCLHRPEVIGGIRAQECGELLRRFFRQLRHRRDTG